MKRLLLRLRAALGGVTQLHVAAGSGYLDVVEAQLSSGVDPNARGREGKTPLHAAVLGGEIAAVEVLLRAGADPNAQTDKGMTALHGRGRK